MPDLNATDEEAVRDTLLGMRAEVRDMLENAGENIAPVKLDQTQQGRLSRMDAMQQQAILVGVVGVQLTGQVDQ